MVARTRLLDLAAEADSIGIEQLCGGQDVLVLAPHSDDETLGCGLAIAAATAIGRRVWLAVITDGSRSHPGSATWPPDRLAHLRRAEVTNALRHLTNDPEAEPLMLGYRDTASPEADHEIAEATRRLLAWMPGSVSSIWSTWEGDPHVDHVRGAALARSVAKSRGDLALWYFPIWGRLAIEAPAVDPARLFRFEAAAFSERKQEALSCHESQMTRLIADDPDGFVMSPDLQAHFLETPEIFIRDAS